MEPYAHFTDGEIAPFEALIELDIAEVTDALRPIVDARDHISSDDVVVAMAALSGAKHAFRQRPNATMLARHAQALLDRAADVLMPPTDNLHLEKVVRLDTPTSVALRQMSDRCDQPSMSAHWPRALRSIADYGVNQDLRAVREAERALAALIRDESQADIRDLARNALVTIHRAAALVSTPH